MPASLVRRIGVPCLVAAAALLAPAAGHGQVPVYDAKWASDMAEHMMLQRTGVSPGALSSNVATCRRTRRQVFRCKVRLCAVDTCWRGTATMTALPEYRWRYRVSGRRQACGGPRGCTSKRFSWRGTFTDPTAEGPTG